MWLLSDGSLPRLAYMTKRLKYCCRWRPCSETSRLSRLSTALNRWSLRLRLSQPWCASGRGKTRQVRQLQGSILNRKSRAQAWHLPDQRVQARRWGKDRDRLAVRSGQWRRWAWQTHLGPRHSGTRAGTRRSGSGMQTERCVQTNSVHSYCVLAGCRGRHTWRWGRAGKAEGLFLEKDKTERYPYKQKWAELTSHWQDPALLSWCENLCWRET